LDTYEVPPRSEGITENHPHCNEIVVCIDELYEDDDGGLARDLKVADWWILASVDDGEVVEVMLHDTWEVEDLDSLNDAIEDGGTPRGERRDVMPLMDRSATSARSAVSAPMQLQPQRRLKCWKKLSEMVVLQFWVFVSLRSAIATPAQL
jgi:hypothetical protein